MGGGLILFCPLCDEEMIVRVEKELINICEGITEIQIWIDHEHLFLSRIKHLTDQTFYACNKCHLAIRKKETSILPQQTL